MLNSYTHTYIIYNLISYHIYLPHIYTPPHTLFIYSQFQTHTYIDTQKHIMVDVERVCCMCGDVGFPDKIFRCIKCHHRFQHTYVPHTIHNTFLLHIQSYFLHKSFIFLHKFSIFLSIQTIRHTQIYGYLSIHLSKSSKKLLLILSHHLLFILLNFIF